MMGFLGEGGNAAMQWGERPVHFSFLFLFGRQTAPVVFILEFLFWGSHFLLRRHRMIPISGRKDFRFASTFLPLVGSPT